MEWFENGARLTVGMHTHVPMKAEAVTPLQPFGAAAKAGALHVPAVSGIVRLRGEAVRRWGQSMSSNSSAAAQTATAPTYSCMALDEGPRTDVDALPGKVEYVRSEIRAGRFGRPAQAAKGEENQGLPGPMYPREPRRFDNYVRIV